MEKQGDARQVWGTCDQVQIDCGNIGDKGEKVSGRGNRANFG